MLRRDSEKGVLALVTVNRRLKPLRVIARGGTANIVLRKSLSDVSAANGGSFPKIRNQLQKNEAAAILVVLAISANSGFRRFGLTVSRVAAADDGERSGLGLVGRVLWTRLRHAASTGGLTQRFEGFVSLIPPRGHQSVVERRGEAATNLASQPTKR